MVVIRKAPATCRIDDHKPRRRRVSAAETSDIVQQLQITPRTPGIARRFSRSTSVIHRIAKRNGILLDRSNISEATRAAITAALLDRRGIRETSRQFDVSHVTVGRIARKLGIKFRRGRRPQPARHP